MSTQPPDPWNPQYPGAPPPPGTGWGAPQGPTGAYSYPPPAYGYTPYGSSGPSSYAGFGSRLGAYLLDALIVGVPAAVLWVIVFAASGIFDSTVCRSSVDAAGRSSLRCPDVADHGGAIVLAFLGMIVLWILLAYFYFVRPIARTGQTIGMRAVGIRVVDAGTGQPIGTGRSIVRLLMRSFISGLICDLGFLWMLWDDRSQTWHDKIADSIVVKV